jgi:hypothetical protein
VKRCIITLLITQSLCEQHFSVSINSLVPAPNLASSPLTHPLNPRHRLANIYLNWLEITSKRQVPLSQIITQIKYYNSQACNYIWRASTISEKVPLKASPKSNLTNSQFESKIYPKSLKLGIYSPTIAKLIRANIV